MTILLCLTGKGVIASIGIDGTRYREYKTGPDLIVSFTRSENIFLWVTLDKAKSTVLVFVVTHV